MTKKFLALLSALSALVLGSTTFTSCNNDDDDKVDTIYVVNKDTVYIENTASKTDTLVLYTRDTLYIFNNDTITINNSSPSGESGVIAEGWMKLIRIDSLGNIIDTLRKVQNADDWEWCGITLTDTDDNYLDFYIVGENDKESYSNLKTGTYKAGSEENLDSKKLGNLVLESDYYNSTSGENVIVKVEKIGQFIDGNYLYAIEGYFTIKGVNGTYKGSYRLIAESDKFAE